MSIALSRRLREGRAAAVPPFTRAVPPVPAKGPRRCLPPECLVFGTSLREPKLEHVRRLLMVLVHEMVRCAVFGRLCPLRDGAPSRVFPRLDYERVTPQSPRIWFIAAAAQEFIPFSQAALALCAGSEVLIRGFGELGQEEWLNNAWRLRTELEAEEVRVEQATRLPVELCAMVVDYLCVTPEVLWQAVARAREP